MPTLMEDLVFQWEFGVKGNRGRMFFKVIHLGVVWGIWRERNKRVFDDTKMSAWEVVGSIVYEIYSWVLMKKEFLDVSMNDMVRNWVP